MELDESQKPKLDEDFEEVTEGEEIEHKERLKTKWAQLEALVGAEKRIDMVAQDLINHFEQRLEAMDGKAMVVCMSRRICVDSIRRLIKIRPDWHHDDDDQGCFEGRYDRLGLRSAGVAEPHPQQAAPRSPRHAL